MEISNFLDFKLQKIKQRDYNLLLFILFFILCAIGISKHEMWRDELEAWLIARDSISISELLENLKYTGHPALWYLCLYLLSKITHNPVIMQLFQLTIAAVIVYVFIYYSTFNKLQKTLFCFGYFPLYEYGVISRSYSLGVLLIFAFCTLYCKENKNYLLLATVLAFLSHTNVYSLIIGFTLATILVYIPIIKKYFRRSICLENRNIANRWILSISIYLFGLSTAIIQIIPPSDAKRQKSSSLILDQISTGVAETSKILIESIRILEKVATSIWRSYVPIPNFLTDNVWGSNILADNYRLPEIFTVDLGSLTAAFFSLILFSVFAFIFIHNRRVLLVYISGTFMILLFGLLINLPEVRHNGNLFILLIACFWIYKYEQQQNQHNLNQDRTVNLRHSHSYQNIFFTIILCFQLYAGIKMYTLDLKKTFSNSNNAAQFIKNNRLEKLAIVGSDHIIVSPISAWLDSKIYYPEIENFGTFTVWTPKSIKLDRDITQQDIFNQIEELTSNGLDSLILILDSELSETVTTPLKITFLKSYKDSIVKDENYFIYSIN